MPEIRILGKQKQFVALYKALFGFVQSSILFVAEWVQSALDLTTVSLDKGNVVSKPSGR